MKSEAVADFRGSLYPWLNVSPGEDIAAGLHSLLRCRQALDDLIDQKITWGDYLDTLATEGVDMDDYLNTAYLNTIACGF
jgi:hypothetical protein